MVSFEKKNRQRVVWLLFIISFFLLEKIAQVSTFQGHLMLLFPTKSGKTPP